MAIAVEQQARRWTYEEYSNLNDDQRYEIIEGSLLMAPAPDTWHQSWLGEIFIILHSYVTARKAGSVFLSPIDVVLDSENTVQPDMVFVSESNRRFRTALGANP